MGAKRFFIGALVCGLCAVTFAKAKAAADTDEGAGFSYHCEHKVAQDARGPARFDLYLYSDTLVMTFDEPSKTFESRLDVNGMSRRPDFVRFVGFENLLGDYQTSMVVPAAFLQGADNSEVHLQGRGDGFLNIAYICRLLPSMPQNGKPASSSK